MAANSQSANVNLNSDRGPAITRAFIALIIISTAAVIGRLIARRLKKANLIASDYTLIFSMIGAWVTTLNGIVEVHFGSGRHIEVVRLNNLIVILKSVYVAEMSYSITIPAIKISILLLYRALFPGRKFAIITNIVGAVVLAWGIAVLLISIFSCKPIHGFWDKSIPSSCVSIRTFFIANSISNIITDVAILSLPVPLVWRLNLSQKQKVALLGMFLTGGLVCIASIVRLVYVFQLDLVDFTYGFYGTTIWTGIEVNVAIVSACLPTLRPLFLYLSPKSQQTFPLIERRSKATPRKSGPQDSSIESNREMSMDQFRHLPDLSLSQAHLPKPAHIKTAGTVGNFDLEERSMLE